MNEQERLVLEVAKYIIENKATVSDTATHFGKSVSSIKKYINNKLFDIDKNAYEAVKKVQNELMIEGRKNGGKTGKRGPSIDENIAIDVARKMVDNGWTLKEAEINIGIPSSTIYERLTNIKDIEIREEIEELFKKNIKFGSGKR